MNEDELYNELYDQEVALAENWQVPHTLFIDPKILLSIYKFKITIYETPLFKALVPVQPGKPGQVLLIGTKPKKEKA